MGLDVHQHELGDSSPRPRRTDGGARARGRGRLLLRPARGSFTEHAAMRRLDNRRLEIAGGWAKPRWQSTRRPRPRAGPACKPSPRRSDGVTLQRMPRARRPDHGSRAGTSASTYDLDGLTTVRSVPITLPAAAGRNFRWLFAHAANSTSRPPPRHRRGSGRDADVVWRSSARRRWSAAPGIGLAVARCVGRPDDPDPVRGRRRRDRVDVEAGIDDVRVTRPLTGAAGRPAPAFPIPPPSGTVPLDARPASAYNASYFHFIVCVTRGDRHESDHSPASGGGSHSAASAGPARSRPGITS